MQLFMDLDKTIGRDFETGLANLKTLTENRATRHSSSKEEV